MKRTIAGAWAALDHVSGLSAAQDRELRGQVHATTVALARRSRESLARQSWEWHERKERLHASYLLGLDELAALDEEIDSGRISAIEAGQRWGQIQEQLAESDSQVGPVVARAGRLAEDLNDPVRYIDGVMSKYRGLLADWPV